MKRLSYWVCLFLGVLLCNAAEVGKPVVVDASKFSQVYPAVWFSPATGDIVSMKERSELPPEEKYEVWIEPRDPEFRIGNGPTDAEAKGIGFSLVGKGAEIFEKTRTWQATKLAENLASLMKTLPASDHPVFYCRARSSACLIMITEWDAKKEVISFRWRRLTAASLVSLPSSLMAGNAEQCWRALCGNRFVLADLPGEPEELTPANPQMVQVSDDPERTLFQEYTVYAARVKHVIVVALFDSAGSLLDYSMRRPPEGIADFSLKVGKKKNEAELVLRFEAKDRPDEKWSVRFQRPELKW